MTKLTMILIVGLMAVGLASTAGASTRSNCGARADGHHKWEVVFGTEKTMVLTLKPVNVL